MATVQDQEDERRRFHYGSHGSKVEVSVAIARVDLGGAAEVQRREKLLCHRIPECAIGNEVIRPTDDLEG